jgi:hypothetical protein
MTTTTTAVMMPAGTGIPAGDGNDSGVTPGGGPGRCKRPGCGRPLPPGERGRSRQFCGDECRIRHYNAMRGQVPAAAPPPADGPEAGLGRLAQLLAEASRLASAVSAQVAEADPGRVAAVLAEAAAARRRAGAHAATASAQAAESAESASAAWEAADAAESGRAAAQASAGAAEEQARDLRVQAGDLAGKLEGALRRAQAAERQAAEEAARRDAARQDAGRAAEALAAERHAAREAAEQARQQAARGLAAVQAACQAQAGAARELAGAAIARAERADAALDAERAERRALTDRLTAAAAPPQPARTRTRATTEKQP